MRSAGILITSYNQAEVYIPSINETFPMPKIKGNPRVWHTLTRNVICGGVFPETSTTCLELTESGEGWKPYSKPFNPPRMAHSAWWAPSGDLVLMGGYYEPRSTEFITAVDSRPGDFTLHSNTRYTFHPDQHSLLVNIFINSIFKLRMRHQ